MNILQMEDMVKGLPDQILMQEAQMPSGQIPQFLALSEVQRRQEMRQKLQAPPEATVADQILQGGIASAMPQQGPQQPPAPPQGMPQGQQMGPPQAPMMAYGGGRMPYAMAGGGMVPSGIVKMQNLGQVPSLSPANADPAAELRRLMEEAYAAGDMNAVMQAQQQLEQLAASASGLGPASASILSPEELLRIPEASRSPEQQAQINQSYPGYTSMVPSLLPSVQGMFKPPAEFDEEAYIAAFKPTMSMFASPDFAERRQSLREQILEEGKRRRKEDIARAERYRTEAEDPIRKSMEEAKRAALGATMTRLGAYLMAGEAEEGLLAATEGAEKILGKAEEAEQAERRAVRQEFRAAERDAIRSERMSADQVFNLQSQDLISDENAQRQFALANSQFAQNLFNAKRSAGESRDKAYNDSVKLTFELAKSIDDNVKKAFREAGLTEREYVQAYRQILLSATAQLRDVAFTDEEGKPRPPTPEEARDAVDNAVEAMFADLQRKGAAVRESYLQQQGISEGQGGMKEGGKDEGFVVDYQGQKFKFNSQENADKFRDALESI